MECFGDSDCCTRALGIAQWYGLDNRGFESRQGLEIFLFTTASRLALGPTQPPMGTGGSLPESKAAGA
jgi:hypothetical protein